MFMTFMWLNIDKLFILVKKEKLSMSLLTLVLQGKAMYHTNNTRATSKKKGKKKITQVQTRVNRSIA